VASTASARAAAPRLARVSDGRQAVRVPLADDSASIAACGRLDGRWSALARKAPPPPQLDVSIWLPPAEESSKPERALVPESDGDTGEARAPVLDADALQRLAQLVCARSGGKDARVQVDALDRFTNSAGRTAQTFRISYLLPARLQLVGGAGAVSPAAHALDVQQQKDLLEALCSEKEVALEWHRALQEEHIEAAFPGAEVRGSGLLKQQAQRAAQPRTRKRRARAACGAARGTMSPLSARAAPTEVRSD
jgi:hypothetical protein